MKYRDPALEPSALCRTSVCRATLFEQPRETWVARIDGRYRPVWENRPPEEQLALGLYFLPHRSSRPILTPTRPRVIKWYCPFANHATFPSGHRYCLNVYAGCAHACIYCYAAGYEPEQVAAKRDLPQRLAKDLEDLERFDVPAAPVHLANSTDPFQPIEQRLGHTRLALEGLLAGRHRFTTVTVLTKNPSLVAQAGYLELLKTLGEISPTHPAAERFTASSQPAVQVEVSLAFWRDAARSFWDPAAPAVADRLDGIRALRAAGIPVVLRIDPLFPRSPLPTAPVSSMGEHGLVEAQNLDDLEHLVSFARELGVRHVVYSPAKIVARRRSGVPPAMQRLLTVYRQISAPGKPVWRGGSWRLPAPVAECLVTEPFLAICRHHRMTAKFCMKNVLDTW